MKLDQYGNTILHTAVKKGNPIIIAQLLSCGAKLDVVDDKNDTPLSVAVRYGRLDAIKALASGGERVRDYISLQLGTFVKRRWLR